MSPAVFKPIIFSLGAEWFHNLWLDRVEWREVPFESVFSFGPWFLLVICRGRNPILPRFLCSEIELLGGPGPDQCVINRTAPYIHSPSLPANFGTRVISLTCLSKKAHVFYYISKVIYNQGFTFTYRNSSFPMLVFVSVFSAWLLILILIQQRKSLPYSLEVCLPIRELPWFRGKTMLRSLIPDLLYQFQSFMPY